MKKISFLFAVLFGLLSVSCVNNNTTTLAIPTGAIRGKVVYSNHNDSKGIIITLEKTDGVKSMEVIEKISLSESEVYSKSLSGTTTSGSDGAFEFNTLSDGYYTVYATSNISTERAVTINATVTNGQVVDVGNLTLTATGSVSGTVQIDGKSTGNEGISVFIAGTSFMATTKSNGTYTITDVPAGENYQIGVTKGLYTNVISKAVSIKANTVNNIELIKIDSSDIPSTSTSNKTTATDDIVYKNTYNAGAYKAAFEISDVVTKSYPFYLYGTKYNDNIQLANPVNKANGQTIQDIPYISLQYAIEFIKEFNITKNTDSTGAIVYTRQFTKSNNVAVKSSLSVDSVKQTIHFDNYDEFNQNQNSMLDIKNIPSYVKNNNNSRINYLVNGNRVTTRNGSPVTVDLKSYGVPLFVKNNEVYISLQSFCDIFNCTCFFNGEEVHYGSQPDSFYNGARERSAILTDFNYKEFCLRMDLQYGLKEIHNITSFDKYFTNTGLKTDFYGTSKTAMDALVKIAKIYLADNHTWFNSPSAYAGKDYESNVRTGDYFSTFNTLWRKLKTLRNNVTYSPALNTLPESTNVHDFRIVGDTAYVTFDSFVHYLDNYNYDYYNLPNKDTLTISDVKDTFGLVCYAHQQIKADPNVKKVVIDLSLNTGGAIDVLYFIHAWIQGNAAFILRDTITGAEEENLYYADVDLDGKIEYQNPADNKWYLDDDTIPSLNRDIKVYCITSGISFSCGNTLPTLLKAYGSATLIGKTTGGGACVVGNGGTADGADIQISSNLRMGYIKNGSFYDTDKGVEPDFNIDDFSNVYDRTKFTAYLDSIK